MHVKQQMAIFGLFAVWPVFICNQHIGRFLYRLFRCRVTPLVNEFAIIDVNEMTDDFTAFGRGGDVGLKHRRFRTGFGYMGQIEIIRGRNRQTQHPGIHHVFGPIRVRPLRNAVVSLETSPAAAPGILHQKAVFIVADDDEGVAALMNVGLFDDPASRILPTAMNAG